MAVRNPILEAALAYARNGWPVFPCSPDKKQPLTPRESKPGARDGGLYVATTDEAQLRAWWAKWPKAMIGVPTGKTFGVVVVDLDPKKFLADEMFAALEQWLGQPLQCARSRTQSGGLHLVFAAPDEPLGNRTHLFRKVPGVPVAIAEHIDVRADGGYVIVPPSVMNSGTFYEWEESPGEQLSPMPQRLINAIAKRLDANRAMDAGTAHSGNPFDGGARVAENRRKYALAALDRTAEDLANEGKGGRNAALNSAAFHMGRFVAAGLLREGQVREAMFNACQRNGLVREDGPESVRKTFESGFGDGKQRPFDVSDIGTRGRPSLKTSAKASGAASDQRSQAPYDEASETQDDGEGKRREPRAMGFDIKTMNNEWAVLLLGSRTVILREHADGPIEDRMRIISVDAFKLWFANRRTEYTNKDGDVSSTTWADRWLRMKGRRQYEGIEFKPGEGETTALFFNLWRGFSVEPKEGGSYSVFRDHLLNNVCHGDAELFRWVFGWFAHIFQRPRERIGTALVLRGGMGTGKTKTGEVIGSLIPSHYFMVDDPRYVTGQFNAHMASCLLLQAEEAVWAGDKAAEGRLKGLITSKFQMIEQKGIDPIRLDNFVRLIMTSNEDWVVPAGKDERRFCVLDVGTAAARDHGYFAEMEKELAEGGREALLYDLLSFDLSQLNLREIPKTEALLEQKMRSLDPVEAWWLGRLRDGTPTRQMSHWPDIIARGQLFSDFIDSSEKAGIKRRGYETEIGIKLHKIAPGLGAKRTVLEKGGDRVWCYLLPTLEEARRAFEDAVGQEVAWPIESDSPLSTESEGSVHPD